MANDEINVVAIFRPKPGKIDHFIELITAVATRIHEQEEDIVRFSVSREVDPKTGEFTNTLVLEETYASKAIFDKQLVAPEYLRFQAKLKAENIIDFEDPIDADIRIVTHLTGFMAR